MTANEAVCKNRILIEDVLEAFAVIAVLKGHVGNQKLCSPDCMTDGVEKARHNTTTDAIRRSVRDRKNMNETHNHDWNNVLVIVLAGLGYDVVVRKASKVRVTKSRPLFPVVRIAHAGSILFDRPPRTQTQQRDAANNAAVAAMVSILGGDVSRKRRRRDFRVNVGGLLVSGGTVAELGSRAFGLLVDMTQHVPKGTSVHVARSPCVAALADVIPSIAEQHVQTTPIQPNGPAVNLAFATPMPCEEIVGFVTGLE